MVVVGSAKKLLVLVLVATTVAGPLLFKSGQHLRVLASGFPLPREEQHHNKQDQAARPQQPPLDCDHQDYSSEYCMFMLETALRSDEGIELIRSMLDTIVASTANGRSGRTGQESSSQVKPHQQHSRRDTRAAAYGPSKTSFVQEALGGESSKSHSEALSKLLMNGLAHDEYNLLDAQDKPLWGGAMSDELGTRWQPMRGKRAE